MKCNLIFSFLVLFSLIATPLVFANEHVCTSKQCFHWSHTAWGKLKRNIDDKKDIRMKKSTADDKKASRDTEVIQLKFYGDIYNMKLGGLEVLQSLTNSKTSGRNSYSNMSVMLASLPSQDKVKKQNIEKNNTGQLRRIKKFIDFYFRRYIKRNYNKNVILDKAGTAI